MVADDSLKKEPQRNADLRHLRHFPPEAAHYCPDESYSVASDSRAGAGDGASAGAGAPVVAAAAAAAELAILVDKIAAVTAVADKIREGNVIGRCSICVV
jgi:hypothetical protein